MSAESTAAVMAEVVLERSRQDAKWGQQDHTYNKWLVILGEEFGEACEAALNCSTHNFGGLSEPQKKYRQELVQIAAVAVAAIESLERDAT